MVGWVKFGTDTAFTLYNMTQATVQLLEGVKEAREFQSRQFTGIYALCIFEHDPQGIASEATLNAITEHCKLE